MTPDQYKQFLHTKNSKVLSALYRKVFEEENQSCSVSKMIFLLHSKYTELYEKNIQQIKIEEEEEEKMKTKIKKSPSTPPPKKRLKQGSRRARIREELVLGIWDHQTLSEALQIENKDWSHIENQYAISGVLYEMRKEGWQLVVKKTGEERGKIFLSC